MKKILCLLAVLLMLPITVFAANPAVLTLDAKADNLIINYTGTVETGSTAVICELYDSSDVKVDYFSSEVNNGAFEGSVTSPKAGTYKLRCAHFEGGAVKEVEVSTVNTANPSTGDPIFTYIAIGAVALIVVGIIVVILSKKKKN